MARVRRASSGDQSEALVAAATRLPGTPTATSLGGRSGAGWQDELFRHYNICGEYRYAVDFVGNLLSRAVLYVSQSTTTGQTKVTTGVPKDYLDALFNGEHPDMLQQIGVHLTIAGECYLVGYEDPEMGGDEVWYVVAAGRMRKSGGVWKVGKEALPTDAFILRLWRPHPLNHGEANSPSRAVLPILREIEKLTMHVAAQLDSRLASAGILFLSNTITFPNVPLPNGETEDQRNIPEQITALLQMTASTAIQERDSAAALVPIVVTVPPEVVDKVNHLKFWSDLDKQAIDLRQEAIRRLALGLDIPPEVMTGVASANHWSAWQVDESAIKAHAEPLLGLITSSLSSGYLRGLLRDDRMAPEEARTYSIKADTSEMRLRPNRSKEALELYDRGVLSEEALRRETGFHEEGGLDTIEDLDRWLMRQIIKGNTSATPEIVAWALTRLGYDDVPTGVEEEAPGARELPSLEEHPTRDLPEVQNALMAACDVLVLRALERAGNRLRSHKAVSKEAAPAGEAYLAAATHNLTCDFLLEDAWGMVERATTDLCGDTPALVRALDTYTRVLLTERRPHDPKMMASYVSPALLVHH